MSPRGRLSPRAPRKPLLIRVVRTTSVPRSPTRDIADRRRAPPVWSPVIPGAAATVASAQERRDPRGGGGGGRAQQAVGDHDERPLGAQLEREVVGGRARVQG